MKVGVGSPLSCPSCPSCLALPETWPWFDDSGCVVRRLTGYGHGRTVNAVRGTKVGHVPCERCAEARQSYIPQPLRPHAHYDPTGLAGGGAKAKGLLEPQKLETLIKTTARR